MRPIAYTGVTSQLSTFACKLHPKLTTKLTSLVRTFRTSNAVCGGNWPLTGMCHLPGNVEFGRIIFVCNNLAIKYLRKQPKKSVRPMLKFQFSPPIYCPQELAR